MENQKQTGEAWVKYLFQKFQENIVQQRIKRHELVNSFKSLVQTEADGDLNKIRIAYKMSGMFSDMGVGRGTKSGEQKDNALSRKLLGKQTGNRRRAKRWYNKTMYGQVLILSSMMAEKYGNRGIALVNDNLPTEINLDL
jgi:hypothetical protein